MESTLEMDLFEPIGQALIENEISNQTFEISFSIIFMGIMLFLLTLK